MFNVVVTHGVEDAECVEFQSLSFNPAGLPAPDYALRCSPWRLESNDRKAQITQLNEEFGAGNQDVTMMMLKMPVEQIQEAINQISKMMVKESKHCFMNDNAGLFGLWHKNNQVILAFFDNGGADAFSKLMAPLDQELKSQHRFKKTHYEFTDPEEAVLDFLADVKNNGGII